MSSQSGDEQPNQPPQNPPHPQYGQQPYGQPQYDQQPYGQPQPGQPAQQPPQQPQYAPPVYGQAQQQGDPRLQQGDAQQPQQGQYAPPPAYAPPGYAPPEYAQQPPKPKTPIWLALISLILGILSLLLWIEPWLGGTLAVIAIVAGIISRKKQWRKGMALGGIITGGVGILLVIAFLGLYQYSQYQVAEQEKRNIAEQLAEEEQAKADEEARYAQSEMVDEARAQADFDSYVEIDAATLESIAADPAAHEGEEYVLNASMGQMLIHEEMWAVGMCAVAFDAAPIVGETDMPIEGRLLDRGGEDECPVLERLTGTTGHIPSMGALTTQNRMWVAVAGPIEMPDGEILPRFILMKMDDAE
ncbi:MAG: hypothetical protein ACTIJ6_00010 [Leucobacter sp.]